LVAKEGGGNGYNCTYRGKTVVKKKKGGGGHATSGKGLGMMVGDRNKQKAEDGVWGGRKKEGK